MGETQTSPTGTATPRCATPRPGTSWELLLARTTLNLLDDALSAPLLLAVRQGQKDIARLLIERAIDQHAAVDKGCTPVQYAPDLGVTQLVQRR